jgi:quinol monooxygenase YgiN
MLAHNVYFSLTDNSAEAQEALIAACQRYLVDHPGIIRFACGRRGQAFARPVNDREWDVGLHIVFTDKAAHDSYQDSPEHHQFVAEMKPNWARARVFDTELA